MAGDEPSEDVEAGADPDGDEDADGDPGRDPASDEPTGRTPEDAPTGDAAEGSSDDSREPVDDRASEAVETAEAAGDTEADESEGTTDDETATDDEALDAEAEALVEEMEAAAEEAEPVEASDPSGDDAVGESDDDEAPADEPVAEPSDDEIPSMAPDQAVDPDVDPPAPSKAEDAEFEVDDEAEVYSEADVDDAPSNASPMVDDVDEPDELDEPDVSEGVFGGTRSGPAEDREMPLAEHIREMLKRLAVVVAVAGVVSLLVFPFAEDVINFLWYSILPGVESEIARPRLYGVLELLFTELKVASLAGLIVALPVLVYETYAFMRPGLYPHERRYYLAAIPTSLVLAIVGVAFAYFVVLPAIFVYFLYYSQDVATIGFALGRTFDLILLMMGYLAVVFQIPLFIMLAMMMGLVTRRWLADRRLLFWGAFLGISFIFSFDPTGMAPIIVAATMIVLFEGTLLLTKWTGRE